MPELPDRFTTALAGRYTIQGELGAGGMATVGAGELIWVKNWFEELRARVGN